LNVSVDPDVRGTVAMNLHDVTLEEALREVVRKNGYSYQLQGRTLRITPIRLATRIFTLDYVALSRIGTANTVIQRRLSSGTSSPSVGTAPGLTTSSPGGGAAGFPGGDVITATEVSDLWTELRVALVGLLNRGSRPTVQGAASATQPAGPAAAQQNANFTGGAFATSWADGTALTLSPSSGLITVTATDDELADIDTYIAAFQSSVLRQVLIEAKIVEVQLSKTMQFGIDWSVVSQAGKSLFTLSSDPTKTTSTGQTGNITFSLPGGSTQINGVLTALGTQGDVNVLSNARTSALNNQRAIFNVTTDEVFFSDIRQPITGPTGAVIGFNDQVQAQTISVGIVLDVIPQISADNVLTMNIRPVVSSLDHIETFTAGDGTSARFPVTSRREGDTMARVRNGETIIIGGLLQTQRNHDVSGIPILKDLPFFGGLFRHVNDTEKRVELVVFLTPTVIAGQPPAGR
jgi:MSHA biogenesis protein MshL